MGRLNALLRLIDEIERDPSLTGPDRLRDRVKALDRIDSYELDSRVYALNASEHEAALRKRAISLRGRLEGVNSRLYQSIRAAIRQGDGRDALLRWAPGSTTQRRREDAPDSNAYDYLDDLVSGVLQFAPPSAVTIELSSEMVAYQPTPARHIFELIQHTEISADDVFIDLGSGLGHVPLLVAICVKADSAGVELEPAYVECARRCARELNLTNVKFLAQDARDVDFSAGTIFYLYTPFRGAILRSVSDRLRAEAQTREIRVCTFGPCTPIVAAESWLVGESAQSGHIKVFRSKK